MLTFRQIILALFLLSALSAACIAQDVARMEQMIQEFVPKQFMGSVLVARGNDVLLSKGYGFANLEWSIPNSPQTKFHLGSTAKQFTAASILLLEDRGKLKLQDPVKKYVPDAPAAWDQITLFHLLTHTSGIFNFTGLPDFDTLKRMPATPESLIARFRNRPLDFEPGSGQNYSNSGYILLGYIIEKVSGQTYADFLRENIFMPLNMKDSGYDPGAAVIPRIAAGYRTTEDGLVPANFFHMSVAYSAGGIYSTVEDLLRWEQSLFGGRLLSATSFQKMTLNYRGGFGLGIMIHNVNGKTAFEHDGGFDGHTSMMSYYPDSKVTVIVLGNLEHAAATLIARNLGTLAQGGTVPLNSEKKEAKPSRETLSKYVGTYQIQPGVSLMVTVEGEQLMVQPSGGTREPLSAESDSKFLLAGPGVQLEFFKDGQGDVTHAVMTQNGRDNRIPRISPTVQERKEIVVSPEILARYVGTYQGTFDVVIALEGNQLTVQRGQVKLPLFAQSEASFFSKTVDFQIDFGTDGLVVHQGANNFRLTRAR
jgi:CubicO group peptidase (beta-lactamase class C family)